MGATGKERISAINYNFKQIFDILIPVHMKYLLWVASESKDLFKLKTSALSGNFFLHTELKNDTT